MDIKLGHKAFLDAITGTFMHHIYKIFIFPFLLFFSLGFIFCFDVKNKAVVITTVADLTGGPIAQEVGLDEIEHIYATFPSAPDKGWHACLRMHQLKYNEVVTIKESQNKKASINSPDYPEQDNPEVECEVSNLFYFDKRGKRRSNFWVLKKNLKKLNELENEIDISAIPEPIDQRKKSACYNDNILTLINPWLDRKTKKIYSAGTRFVRCKEKDTGKAYAFCYIDFKSLCRRIGYVSKKSALVHYPKTEKQMRKLFVKILRGWARSYNPFHSLTSRQRKKDFIPYVYGGCSHITRCVQDDFSLNYGKRCGRKVSYWQRRCTPKELICRDNSRDNFLVQSGLDCSGMLLMAAQIVGMPYFCKNTQTLKDFCSGPLRKSDQLQEGDLIWYPGHVMVVSNIKRGLLIEAVGYEAGHGKVHEIPIHRVFDGIKNYQDLLKNYYLQRGVKRLNEQKKCYKFIRKFRIYKLF